MRRKRRRKRRGRRGQGPGLLESDMDGLHTRVGQQNTQVGYKYKCKIKIWINLMATMKIKKDMGVLAAMGTPMSFLVWNGILY